MKKILIIDAHPDEKSLVAFLCQRYEAAAKENHQVEKFAIRDLKFDPILHYGYREIQDLEADLLMAQDKIKNCEHLVIFVPNWWGSLPALAKGFLERTLIRGFSHRFNPEKKKAEQLLKGRTASVIYTQASPKFYTRMIGDAFWKCLKNSILRYVGFSDVKRFYIPRAKKIDENRLANLLQKLDKMGKEGF